jgi:dienelactone hydrolase
MVFTQDVDRPDSRGPSEVETAEVCMAVVSEAVRYQAAGRPMHGRLFRDEAWTGARPGVLVYPDGFGLGDFIFAVAERFAALGYVSLACDLYGNGFRSHGPSEAVRAENDRASDPAVLRAIGESAYGLFAARPEVDAARIAAAGYCFGGTVGLDLAFSGAPVAAVAAFHPSFRVIATDQAERASGRLHLFVGAEDYAAPPATRAAFEAGMAGKGVRWRMTLYGGVKHAFTDPDCPGMGEKVAYDAAADRDSWDATVAMFAEAFAETGGG